MRGAQPCPGAWVPRSQEQDQAPGGMVQVEPLPQKLFQPPGTAGWRDLSPKVWRQPYTGVRVLTLISY